MPLIGLLDSARLRDLQTQALGAVERTRVQDLVLDITGVPFVDAYVGRGLILIVQAVRLLGAEVTIVGIRPEVAQTMAELGVALQNMRTFTDLQTGLQYIRKSRT